MLQDPPSPILVKAHQDGMTDIEFELPCSFYDISLKSDNKILGQEIERLVSEGGNDRPVLDEGEYRLSQGDIDYITGKDLPREALDYKTRLLDDLNLASCQLDSYFQQCWPTGDESKPKIVSSFLADFIEIDCDPCDLLTIRQFCHAMPLHVRNRIKFS